MFRFFFPLIWPGRGGFPPICQCAGSRRRSFRPLLAPGLTAAVSAAPGAANMPCNMIAAAQGDHVFVPGDRAMEELALRNSLSASARQRGHANLTEPCKDAIVGLLPITSATAQMRAAPRAAPPQVGPSPGPPGAGLMQTANLRPGAEHRQERPPGKTCPRPAPVTPQPAGCGNRRGPKPRPGPAPAARRPRGRSRADRHLSPEWRR